MCAPIVEQGACVKPGWKLVLLSQPVGSSIHRNGCCGSRVKLRLKMVLLDQIGQNPATLIRKKYIFKQVITELF